jgi:hypothetical protein
LRTQSDINFAENRAINAIFSVEAKICMVKGVRNAGI